MLQDISLQNLSLDDSSAPAVETILLDECVSKVREACKNLHSGLLLTGADRATRRQIVSLAIPNVTFVSCADSRTDLLLQRSHDSPPVCLDDLDSVRGEGLAKGVFTRHIGSLVLGLATEKRSVPGTLLRAGRFEVILNIDPPSPTVREKAWRSVLLGLSARELIIDIDKLAKELADWSPGFGLTDFRLVLYKFLARDAGTLGGHKYLKDIVASHKPVTATGELDFVNASATSTGVDAIEGWDGVGGYSEVKDMLVRLCEWPFRYRDTFTRLGVAPPRGVLLYGPRGCGKTRLALAFLKRLRYANWLHVNGPDVFSKYLGESEARVRALFARARSLSPCVVFIDELDAMGAGRTAGGDGGGTGVERRVLGSLLTELDGIGGGDVFVLSCASELGVIDPALLRPGRLDHLIEVKRPDEVDRQGILEELLRDISVGEPKAAGAVGNKEDMIKCLARDTVGMTGAELEALCREAAMVTMEEEEHPECIAESHFRKAKERVSKRNNTFAIWGL